ncbi:hypothetical protein, partial [Flavihumibacter sp. CACIAM 22H1]|uniref:hypothetical protein n=1 Tax=Flavihumibacter sp. CACIAM 22H1 TaxID=1812911 RepID=UPI000AEF0239
MKKTYPLMLPTSTALYKILFLLIGFVAVQKLQAQTALYFHNPALINGEPGQVGASYKFTGVITASNGQPLTDCVVRIESLSQGIELLSIDQAESTQEAAFQPVIEHQQTIGAAAVSFSFDFIPHDPSVNNEGKYVFPALAASLSGLKGLGEAQAFAECAIGKNGVVWLNKKNKHVLVARSGEAFRAQYKWGIDGEEMAAPETPIVFANSEVSSFKLKMGVNSKTSPFNGRSVCDLLLTESMPVSNVAENIRFASLEENFGAIPEWTEADPCQHDSTKNKQLKNIKLAGNLLVFIPDEMLGKQV